MSNGFDMTVLALIILDVGIFVQSFRKRDPSRGSATVLSFATILLMVSGACTTTMQPFSYVSSFIKECKNSDNVFGNLLPVSLILTFYVLVSDLYNTYLSTSIENQSMVQSVALQHGIAAYTSFLCVTGIALLLYFDEDDGTNRWKHYMGVVLVLFSALYLHLRISWALFTHNNLRLLYSADRKPKLNRWGEFCLIVGIFVCYIMSALLMIVFTLVNFEDGSIAMEYVWLISFAIVSWICTRAGDTRVDYFGDNSALICLVMLVTAFALFFGSWIVTCCLGIVILVISAMIFFFA